MGFQFNSVLAFVDLFKGDIDFGLVKRYIITEPKEGATSFLNAEDDSSLITYKSYNKGKIIYYGLFDDENDFKFSPDYPIFWNNLVNFMLETEYIIDYNFRIGERTTINRAGFYEEGIKDVAYNLLDDAESDVSSDPSLFAKEDADFVSKDIQEEQEFDLTILMLIIVSLILLFETFYIKYRGDL